LDVLESLLCGLPAYSEGVTDFLPRDAVSSGASDCVAEVAQGLSRVVLGLVCGMGGGLDGL